MRKCCVCGSSFNPSNKKHVACSLQCLFGNSPPKAEEKKVVVVAEAPVELLRVGS